MALPWYAEALRNKARLEERNTATEYQAFAPNDPKSFLSNYLASNFPQTVSQPSPMQREAFVQSTMRGNHPSETARNSLRGMEDMKRNVTVDKLRLS
jgi:hypothetical protein